MATVEETIDQVTDEELFKGEPAAPVEQAEEARAETTQAEEDRLRDEKGRFKAKTEESPEPEPIAEQAPEEKPDHRIPLVELLNEREKRQNEQRQREALEQRLMALQRQLEQATAKPEEPIDIFADPQAYQQTVEQKIEQRLKAQEGNFSLRLARALHKEVFDEAWAEMVSQTQMGNDSMRQQVLNSSDPGETLVALYKQAKTFKEVNGDPNAWLEAKKAEWLKDPAVQAQIIEAVKSAGSQPKTQVKLPPSLNKATASGSSAGDKGDMSDGALWQHTLG